MPLNMRFRFSPTKDGLVKVLGPLETEIMQTIWQDERSTVKKVHRKLSQQRADSVAKPVEPRHQIGSARENVSDAFFLCH